MNRYNQLVVDLRGEPTRLRLEGYASVLSEESLHNLEAELGYALPADYREFLRDYGGYGFSYARCEVFRSWSNNPSIGRVQVFDLVEFYTVAPRTSLDIVAEYNTYKESFVSPEVLPIAFAGGSNTYCLTLAGEQRGTVSLYIMDDLMLHPIAPSFDEFLHKLVVVDE